LRLDADQERLLHEASEWRLLGLLFEYPGERWHERVAALGTDVREARLQAAAHAAAREASPGLHQSLFGPGGPVSLREATYSSGIQLGYLLSELGAHYEAFAYRPATTEPADHLSVEVGFLAYLKMKQAYALAAADDEHAALTEEVAERFRCEHLAVMAERIATPLEAAGPPYLALAAAVLRERVGPPASRPPILAVANLCDDDAEGEMRCGGDAAACASGCDLGED
jgi:nitrate reductase assembly molybdenum cofactor insertion protein NarJ